MQHTTIDMNKNTTNKSNMTKKLQLLLLFAAMFCGISAYAAPGGTLTVVDHPNTYPTPQNVTAALTDDGKRITLQWDGVHWPVDGYSETIDGKEVPTNFYYEVDCRTRQSGTTEWGDWWNSNNLNRYDWKEGYFLERVTMTRNAEAGMNYQFRVRCVQYVSPENPIDLPEEERIQDVYSSEWSDTVQAYRTLDKLAITEASTSHPLNGYTTISVKYTYTSSREAEGEEPLYFTFKAIEIPYPAPGTTPEAPAEGGKPYARRDGTPLDVKSLTLTSPNTTKSKKIAADNFALTSSADAGTITWDAYQDLKNYSHDDVTIWIQGWAKSETEGGKPRLVVDEAIGKVAIDTRPCTAKPGTDASGKPAVILTWPKEPTAATYKISRGNNNTYITIADNVADTIFVDTEVQPVVRYAYQVIAKDSTGKEFVASSPFYGYSQLDLLSIAGIQPQSPWNGKIDIFAKYKTARDEWTRDGKPYFKLTAKAGDKVLDVKTLSMTVITPYTTVTSPINPDNIKLEEEDESKEYRLVWDAGTDLGGQFFDALTLTIECAGVEPDAKDVPGLEWTGGTASYTIGHFDTRSPRVVNLAAGTPVYADLVWFDGATKADVFCNGTKVFELPDEAGNTRGSITLSKNELNTWGENELKLVPDKGEPWTGVIKYPDFDFSVSQGMTGGITLMWSLIDQNAVAGYRIQRRIMGSTDAFEAVRTVGPDVMIWTDKTAEEATLYEYTVVPLNSDGEPIGPIPSAQRGYRTLEKIEFVQARQFYPWSTRVAIDIYYKSARQSSTDGEVTYVLKAKMADGTEIPIDSKNLTLETVDGLHLLPTDLPFGSKGLPSGATTRLWWNAPADLGTVQLSSNVISGITLQVVPTLAEGAPAGAKPAPVTVTSPGITVDLRTKRTVAYGEQIPVVWEWWRTDGRVEAHDKNVFYVKPEGSETDETMVWHTPEHSGEGTIEVPENEDLWPSFRLVKREMNTDDTDETKQITLTSEVLFQMPVAVPQNVQATRGNTDALTLTWDAVPYADRYQIEVTTIDERGATTKRTQYVFDGTRYVDQYAPALGIVGYKVQACFPNNVTSDFSEQVVGWRAIDQVELKGVSTRRPWKGTVDIDLTYKTVRNQFTKLNGTNLPDRKVSVTAKTADGAAFLVQSLVKETLEGNMIWREQVDGKSPFTLGNAGRITDRITWNAPADAPRIYEPNSVITITFPADEYSEEIKFERTFDLNTRTGVIEVLSSEVDIPIPWSTRWAKLEATQLGFGENDAWRKQTAVLSDITDWENPREIMRSENIILGDGTVTSWTPKEWGYRTLQLILRPSNGANEATEYAVFFNVVPDFKFTATQGNRDSIVLEWNELKGIHSYSIRRRAANTSDAFTEVAICTDTTRWADTSAETIVGEFEYTIMPLNADGTDAWTQFTPVVGYRALDIARPVTIEPAENGTVTADKETAKYGETVTLTIAPAIGYEFDRLTVLDGETAINTMQSGEFDGVPSYTFTMPAGNVKVQATFKAIDYTITIEPSENGTVTADKQTAHVGETVTLTITPAEGYELDQLNVPLTEGNTFNMLAGDVIISATFKMIDYTVTIQPTDGGTITADKATANMGETVTLTVTPNEGYEFDQLTVMNGETKVDVVAAEGNYTFVMPAGNVEITATYKAIDYDVILVSPINGEVTADKTTAHVGETVTLTVTPAKGYELDEIHVMFGGTRLTTVSEGEGIHTFVMPAGDVVISVLFQEATGTDVIAPDAVKATTRKVLRNGIVYILRDGKTYTATGTEVK